jgi:hypothetical protein
VGAAPGDGPASITPPLVPDMTVDPAFSGGAAVVASNSFLNCSAADISSLGEGTGERGVGASGTRAALGADGASRAGSGALALA